MIKKSFAVLLISVFLFSILATGFVSAICYDTERSVYVEIEEEDCVGPRYKWEQASTPQTQDDEWTLSGIISPNFANLGKWLRTWEKGETVSSIFLKYLFLILIIILVFSALSYSRFPESSIARIVIAIAVGFLSTIMIQPEELIAMVSSYTAMGAAFILFLPILILGFFTLVVSTKVAPVGIVIQRLLWLFYSLYLFVTSGGALAMSISKIKSTSFIYKFFEFFGIEKPPQAGGELILAILFVSSIIIFVVAVLYNKSIVRWGAEEMRDADLTKYRDIAKRSKASREADAEITREHGKESP